MGSLDLSVVKEREREKEKRRREGRRKRESERVRETKRDLDVVKTDRESKTREFKSNIYQNLTVPGWGHTGISRLRVVVDWLV